MSGADRCTTGPHLAKGTWAGSAVLSGRRVIGRSARVVRESVRARFAHDPAGLRRRACVRTDGGVPAPSLNELVITYKNIGTKNGRQFPQDVSEQLWGAISAVFKSWYNPRAKVYRCMHDIHEIWCTACNVQAMVFGNLVDGSGTGCGFMRSPSSC